MTTDKTEKRVRMADQIEEFYAAMPENEATESVARKLKRYWTPKMIRKLFAYADADQAGLSPTVARALKQAARA